MKTPFCVIMLVLLRARAVCGLVRLDVKDAAELVVGSALHLSLQTDDGDGDLSVGELCLTANGEVCHCFPAPLSSVQSSSLILPASCVQQEGFYLGAETAGQVTTAVRVGHAHTHNRGKITLILPLTSADLDRATVLFYTLARIPDDSFVASLIILTPEQDVYAVSSSPAISSPLPFPVHVHGEAKLLGPLLAGRRHFPYAVQMALKLLVASIVETDHYLTLDADVLLLQPTLLPLLVQQGRALYQDESRGVHWAWWQGSAAVLGLDLSPPPPPHPHPHPQQPAGDGFSVTPALLSTYGALVTLSLLKRRFSPSGGEAWVSLWVSSLGEAEAEAEEGEVTSGGPLTAGGGGAMTVWTEYTLYRLALDSVGLFAALHTPSSFSSSSSPSSLELLHCFDVWFSADLPWKAQEARALLQSSRLPCLFSVVQSTSGANVGELMEQVYYLFFS